MKFNYSLRDKDFEGYFGKESISDSSSAIFIEVNNEDGDLVDEVTLYMTKKQAQDFAVELMNSFKQ